jgi:hypothetical protein
MPGEIELVGPGDFPLTAGVAGWRIRAYGITLANRGGRPGQPAGGDRSPAGGRMVGHGPRWRHVVRRRSRTSRTARLTSPVDQTPMLRWVWAGCTVWRCLAPRAAGPPAGHDHLRGGHAAGAAQRRPPARGDCDLRRWRSCAPLGPAAAEDRARYDRGERAAYDLRLDFAAEDGAPLAYDGRRCRPGRAGRVLWPSRTSSARCGRTPAWRLEPFLEDSILPGHGGAAGSPRHVRGADGRTFDVYSNTGGERAAAAALAALAALRTRRCL